MAIGQNIKKYRKKNKLTQKQLGLAVGKKEITIRKYESEAITPNMKTLELLAKSLNTNIYNLIDNNDNLTSKLIKLFEKTICKDCDADNTLELLCELIDIDPDVINKSMSEDEDLSQSYLISIINIIFREYPDVFSKFYDENKELISSEYSLCYDKCEELLRKRNENFANKTSENIGVFKVNPSKSLSKDKITELSKPLKQTIDNISRKNLEKVLKSTPTLHEVVSKTFEKQMSELLNADDFNKIKSTIENLNINLYLYINFIANRDNIKISDSQINEIVSKIYDSIDFEVFKIGKSQLKDNK